MTGQSNLDQSDVLAAVDCGLTHIFENAETQLNMLMPEARDLLDGIHGLVSGGKRLRPRFFVAGWRAFDDATPSWKNLPAGIGLLGAGLELFHAGALLHDDVMDRSDTRRGKPALHRHLASEFQTRQWHGDANQFGVSGAILAGDMCLAWAEEAFTTALQQLGDADEVPLSNRRAAQMCFDAMRSQLMVGQYLDMTAQARGLDANSVDAALRVIEHKSARYTATSPLLIGANLAGVDDQTLTQLERYGVDLGLAFQLRDDVLGVFGDAAVTGKPSGDDLVEGKQTVLLAMAAERANPSQHALLKQQVGRPDLSADEIVELQNVLTDCGALAALEELIDQLTDQAHQALESAQLSPASTQHLRRLIDVATRRTI